MKTIGKSSIVMMLLTLAFFAINTNAATFNVNITTDTQDVIPGNGICEDLGGNCSLRAAITEANALAGADTINLPAGTYTQTLAGSENNNAGGDWDINTDLTINGADSLTTFVQANAVPGVATERVFHVRFTAGMVVNINDVTIENGRNTGNVFGAGIRLDLAAGTLNLDDSIVRNNRNASSGGGISLSGAAGATLNITDSTISDNIAGSTTAGTSGTGGGIQINNSPATVNISNSTISNNTATSGITFGLGGGISANGTVTITDSTISGNTASSSANSSFGGGLYIPSGTTTITDTTISNNTSTSTAGGAFSGFAGGIYNQNAGLMLIKSLLKGNSASHFHGGLRTLASTAAASTKIINSTISLNLAPLEGGGVANVVGSTFNATTEIENSTINNNSTAGAVAVGGGVLNFSGGAGTALTTCLNSTLSGNSAGAGGGNLHNQQNAGAAIVDINFCTITGGAAPLGGGINNVSGPVNIKNSILAGNNGTTGPNISGTLTSQDYNLVQSISGGTFIPMANDEIGSDPLLGPLQNNGGLTLTHHPSALSPAIDKIPDGANTCGTGISVDQRSFVRPSSIANLCDKGAVEDSPSADSPFDFDGDRKMDLALTRNIGAGSGGAPNQLRWFINLSGSGTTVGPDWGVATDILVAEDFDGDGKTDVAVWRPLTTGAPSGNAFFFILQSQTNTFRLEEFGQVGDNPLVTGDYDGDRKADPAVYRPGIGGQSFFYVRNSSNNPSGNITFIPWGTGGDVPVRGDYDGDGSLDIVIVRSGGGTSTFFIKQSTGGHRIVPFGLATDKPVSGDYDGDGKTDVGILRNVGGVLQWWIFLSSTGQAIAINFGIAQTDFPLQGDYDGDGKSDIMIWRPSSQNFGGSSPAAFWIRRSATNDVVAIPFGLTGDYPVASRGITPIP